MALEHRKVELKLRAIMGNPRSALQSPRGNGQIVSGTGDSGDVIQIRRRCHSKRFASDPATPAFALATCLCHVVV